MHMIMGCLFSLACIVALAILFCLVSKYGITYYATKTYETFYTFQDVRSNDQPRNFPNTNSALSSFFLVSIVVLPCLINLTFPHTGYSSTTSSAINLEIIKQIESQGCKSPCIGDDGKSFGPYQIQEATFREFQASYPTYAKLKWPTAALNANTAYLIANFYISERIPQMLRYYKLDPTTDRVLWAYNAGIGNVVKGKLPKSTKEYISRYYRLERSSKHER